jgi:hypothetical protein
LTADDEACLVRGVKRIIREGLRHDSVAVLAAFILGAFAAGALLFFDVLGGGSSWEEAGRRFLRRPETIVWLTLLTAQAGLWVVGWGAARRLLPKLSQGQSAAVSITGFALVGVLVVAVIVVPAVTTPTATPLPLHRPKVIAFIVLGALAAAPWIEAIWRVGTIARMSPTPVVDGSRPHAFDTYLRLRELLGHAVVVLGVIVAGITLTTGALRLAVLAHTPAANFPISSVLVYGGFFSLLLALIYVPVQLRVIELGNRLRDEAVPITARGRLDAFKRRGEVETVLQLATGPIASMQAGLAVLAPLLTALLAQLLSSD